MRPSNKSFPLPVYLSLAVFLSACASSYQPVVDMRGINRMTYERDLAECRSYTDQVDATEDAATGALVGGGLGAAFGAALGAIGGNAGTGAAIGATAGGFGGGASQTGQAVNRKHRIMDNCMINRGYTILG